MVCSTRKLDMVRLLALFVAYFVHKSKASFRIPSSPHDTVRQHIKKSFKDLGVAKSQCVWVCVWACVRACLCVCVHSNTENVEAHIMITHTQTSLMCLNETGSHKAILMGRWLLPSKFPLMSLTSPLHYRANIKNVI